MTKRFHGEILREFGEMIGVPALAFDDAGTCGFIVDQTRELVILCTRDQLVLTLSVPLPDALMELPAKQVLSLFPRMTLETLRGESPVVVWHPQASHPIAIATLPQHLASAAQLAATTVELLDWCDQWCKSIDHAQIGLGDDIRRVRQSHDPARAPALC
ncbi:CesT family type III secretion system chaperone [Pandoraea sp. NPDC087047]|uniref:CesT family type III secretion system chaperone n=1 Tax=Pandoraea sp. NPDC087047 TaxID=3364390 RepID=UPI00381C1B03